MTRDELIERIARRTKVSRPQAETLVCTIFDSLEQSLRQGERVEIRGFGTFQVRSYKGYKGRNPRTGHPVEVAPKRLPFFKASKKLAAGINRGREKKPVWNMRKPLGRDIGIPDNFGEAEQGARHDGFGASKLATLQRRAAEPQVWKRMSSFHASKS